MLFGMGAKLLYALTRVALPPLALAHVGLAEYGLWAACFVLVAYLGMAASGFTLVYLRGIAEHHGRGDVAAIGRLLSTGILAMGAVALALLAALGAAMPALLELFRVDPAQRALAATLWLGACAVFLADMSLGAFASLLHAVGRVRDEQRVWVAAFVLETAAIVALLHAGLGIHALLAAFALRYVFSASANALLAWRALPGLRLSWRDFDPALLRAFFTQGAAMQGSGLIASALHSADRLLAGALIGPHATALVDLAAKLPTTAGSIASGASGVAVSAAARHDTQGRRADVAAVYRDATRVTVAGLAATLPFLAWFASPLTMAWLGPGKAQAALAPLVLAASLALHAHLLTGPVNAVRRGCGRLDGDYAYHAARVVALALAVAVWQARGGAGVTALAVSLAVAQGAAATGFLGWAHRRAGGRWRELAATVAMPSVAAHGLAALLASWTLAANPAGRGAAIAALVVPALAWAVAVAALLAAMLLGPGQRQSLANRLRRRRPVPWSNA
jgi:O-antigen/teichoic acid export membrane protein